MEFQRLFEYHGSNMQKFIEIYQITRATFYNWKRCGVSLSGQLKAELLTNGKFKASKEALKRG